MTFKDDLFACVSSDEIVDLHNSYIKYYKKTIVCGHFYEKTIIQGNFYQKTIIYGHFKKKTIIHGQYTFVRKDYHSWKFVPEEII